MGSRGLMVCKVQGCQTKERAPTVLGLSFVESQFALAIFGSLEMLYHLTAISCYQLPVTSDQRPATNDQLLVLAPFLFQFSFWLSLFLPWLAAAFAPSFPFLPLILKKLLSPLSTMPKMGYIKSPERIFA